jgi:hypothetical protein
VLFGDLYVDVTDLMFEDSSGVAQFLDSGKPGRLADSRVSGVHPDFHRIPPMLAMPPED